MLQNRFVSIIKVVAHVTRYRARGVLAVAAWKTDLLTASGISSNISTDGSMADNRGIRDFL